MAPGIQRRYFAKVTDPDNPGSALPDGVGRRGNPHPSCPASKWDIECRQMVTTDRIPGNYLAGGTYRTSPNAPLKENPKKRNRLVQILKEPYRTGKANGDTPSD